jgi:hypothetical protein
VSAGVPDSARFEKEIAPGVAIWDVSHLLPKHQSRRYKKRDPKNIRTIAYHKSGADGLPGFAGLMVCVQYVIRSKNYPGAAYTYWGSRKPDRDNAGRLVVYRCHADEVHSWHTGGVINGIGIAVGWQGLYDGEWDLLSNGLPRVDKEPTAEQWLCINAMTPHLLMRHNLNPSDGRDPDGIHPLTGHWEWGKRVCPGDAIRLHVLRARGDLPAEPVVQPGTKVTVAAAELNPYAFKARDIQSSLNALGFDAGPVDGLWGYRSRAALEAFQRSVKLTVDGWYGNDTAGALLLALRERGLSTKEKANDIG